jgi:hypothetical protein
VRTRSFSSIRIPHVEDEGATRVQYATGLAKRSCLPGKEHGPELADDHIKLAIRERQLHRIRLTPLHRSGCSNRMVVIEHGLIQVRRHDGASVGQ